MNFEKFGVKIGGELCPHNYKIIKVKKGPYRSGLEHISSK